jgi:anti-sigma factor RsiW
MNSPTFRDVEQLSAYLDGQLPQAEAARLEQKLKADPQLADLHRQLSQARMVLRQLPARRAPRNFTLTPQMAGVKAPTPRTFSIFGFASAFASLLLVLTFAANAFGALAGGSMAAAPVAYGIGGGPVETAPESRPQSGGGDDMAATEMPAAAAPIAPAATQAPAAAAELAPETTPTPEAMRIGAAPVEPTAETFAKQAPALPPPQPVTAPEPGPPLVAGWLQGGLLALAVLSAGIAWFVRWRANRDFRQKNR